MKMDATQKRRMWKVAIIHFCLTLFVIATLFNSGWSGRSGTKAEETWIIKETLKIGTLVLLQPQLGILFAASKFFPNAMAHYFSWVRPWLLMAVWFVSIPIWSICFGWIYVKFTNWLNHFPVLGKRVF
jgi:hypothetical protein